VPSDSWGDRVLLLIYTPIFADQLERETIVESLSVSLWLLLVKRVPPRLSVRSLSLSYLAFRFTASHSSYNHIAIVMALTLSTRDIVHLTVRGR